MSCFFLLRMKTKQNKNQNYYLVPNTQADPELGRIFQTE